MGLLNDDETTVVLANDSNETLCNVSALVHPHASNPYILAWYLKVRFFSCIMSCLEMGLLSRKVAAQG